MLYWNSIYYFLVTRNAKKAKKKEESDQGPEYNELPETDSEKEEGASSTTTSDTDDEGEEEAKTNNTTPVKHNTKSATKRCVKTFILTFIDYFNINEYVLKTGNPIFTKKKIWYIIFPGLMWTTTKKEKQHHLHQITLQHPPGKVQWNEVARENVPMFSWLATTSFHHQRMKWC